MAAARRDPHADRFVAGPALPDVGAIGRAARARAEQVAIDDVARREQLERERQEMRDIVADGTDEDFIAWLRRRAGIAAPSTPIDARTIERQAPWMSGKRRELLDQGLSGCAEIIAGVADHPNRKDFRPKRIERWATFGQALAELVRYLTGGPPRRGVDQLLDQRRQYGTQLQWTVRANSTPAELSLVEDLVHVQRAVVHAYANLPPYDAEAFARAQCEVALVLRYACGWPTSEIVDKFAERETIGKWAPPEVVAMFGGVALEIVTTPKRLGRVTAYGARRAYAYLRPRALVAANEEWDRRMRMDDMDTERRRALGRDLVGAEAIARHLGVSDRSVRNLVARGMPVYRVPADSGTVMEASSVAVAEWFRAYGWQVDLDDGPVPVDPRENP